MNPDFTLFGLCLTSTLKKIAKISCLQLMKEFQIRFNHKAKRSNAKKFNFRRLPKSSPLNCWVEISYCSEIYFFLRQTQLRTLYKNVPRSGWGPRQEKTNWKKRCYSLLARLIRWAHHALGLCLLRPFHACTSRFYLLPLRGGKPYICLITW